jgi:hypothetical protein
MTAPLTALCGACLAHRTDVPLAFIESACAGRRMQQVDCGDDIMFSGIGIGVWPDAPCPRCGAKAGLIAVTAQVAKWVGREPGDE